jgi:hypothetical protein
MKGGGLQRSEEHGSTGPNKAIVMPTGRLGPGGLSARAIEAGMAWRGRITAKYKQQPGAGWLLGPAG